MPRRWLKRLLPTPQSLRDPRLLRLFGKALFAPDLWHHNCRSVAKALACGLFFACQPIPMQMLAAAGGALWLRYNLPLGMATVWVSNPVTIPPLFFFNYRVGAWLLDYPPYDVDFQVSLIWLRDQTHWLLKPLLLGSLVVGTLAALVVYGSVTLGWRFYVYWQWRRRNRLRASFHRRDPEP